MSDFRVTGVVRDRAANSFFCLAVSIFLATLLFSSDANGHAGVTHGPIEEGYHAHVASPTGVQQLTCGNVEECREEWRQWKQTVSPSYAGCGTYPAVSSAYVGPTKPGSQWKLTTHVYCDLGPGGAVTHHALLWIWNENDVPPECDRGTDAPYCEHSGPQYYTEVPVEAAPDCNESNPCNPADGNKSQIEIDYSSPAIGGLQFARYYNSRGTYQSDATLAFGWRHTYSRSLDEVPLRSFKYSVPSAAETSSFYSSASDACTSGWNEVKTIAWGGEFSTGSVVFEGGNTCRVTISGATVGYLPVRSATAWANLMPALNVRTLTRPNGRSYKFEKHGSDWVSKLNPELSLHTSGGNYVFTDVNDTEETYDTSGRLISITYRNGQTETLDYDLTAAQGGDDDSTTLDRVTGPFGHELTFSYDASGRIDTVTTPDGTITYAYGGYDTLDSATYPDTTTRQYLYEEPHIAGWPHHLVGLIDENGVQFATWDYDLEGRAILSEHAGGQERVEFQYNSNGTTTLTTANGAQRTYTYEVAQGRRSVMSLSGDVCSTCPGGNIQSRSYDINGFVSQFTDWEGNTTLTARNNRGLIETLTEASGTVDQRVTTAAWHTSFRLPTSITTPTNTTTYTHDGNGNILSVTVSGDGLSRTWNLTYDTNGQVLTVDGARTDLTDVTTFEYYSCTTGAECGQLKKITNALSHVTNFNTYDNSGRLTKMTDPNGLETTLTYDSRGRVLTTVETPTVGTARTTTMSYDDVGLLQTLTTPDGVVLTYAYNDAHELISVTDNANNRIDYTYDAMGNLTDEDTYDPLSTLKRSMDYAYDLNNRLDSVTDGNITADLNIDLVGNLTSDVDGNQRTTQHAYDALNRLATTTNALTGVTNYDFDAHDNVTSVTAPNNAVTTYEYDGLDNLTKEISPDRGTITYTYDEAGNLKTRTDARGITATFVYDALNRVTSVTYPTTAENMTYTYDHAGSEGIGRLRSISDQSGTTTYGYDEFGYVTSDARQIGAHTHTTSYAYDADGNVTSTTYPSGRVIDYGRDAIGQITSVTSTKSSVQKTIVSAATYEPFGPLASITHGNGITVDYDRRNDYRIDSIGSANLLDRTYSYDGAANITRIVDGLDADGTRDLAYDALNRLTVETAPADYSAPVLADNPLVYWRLGDLSGSVAQDASGNGHDGTYGSSSALGEPGLVGGDTAVRIDPAGGLNGQIQGAVLTGESVTGVELWFSTDSVAGYRDLVSVQSNNHVQMILYHHTNGKIVVWKQGVNVLTSDATVSTGTAHHVALWYEAGSGKTYMMIDGVTQTNNYTGNALAATDPQVIAGGYLYYSTAYSRMLGELDELAVYDTAVTATTFAGRFSSAGGASTTFTYDSNGNRTLVDEDGTLTSYGYATASNQLTTIGGSSLTRDASGNRTADVGGTRTYTYNDQNRLSAVLDNSVTTATYVHNAMAQRTKKTVGSSDVIYLYDLQGNLIAEHDGTGALIRDYVWMSGMPVAQIDAGEGFLYLHVDHLNTPRTATSDSQTVVWRWRGDAFGSTLADEDPDGDLVATTVNLRFPGQYFDAETGFHYNYFRTYDPTTGRYLESDPIGLVAGPNTYGYVGASPLRFIDPLGLDAADWAFGVVYDLTGGWSPSQTAVDRAAGFGDGISGGLTKKFRDAYDIGTVNECSATYRRWRLAGIPVGIVAAGGVLVKGLAPIARPFLGPGRNWIRLKGSYSRSADQRTKLSLSWGASPTKNQKYVKQIPNLRFRAFNQWLRNIRIRLPGRRFADSGHIHIRM